MDANRRYTEDEIARILDAATEAQSTGSSSTAHTDGLTLSELHDIGDEVGIPKELITRAATTLDRGGPPPARRLLGTTIGVGRTTHLPRRLTDAEWNRLVVDLRETFDARGKLREEGAFRQWTNSNLQALLEPDGIGQRLRLKTLSGNGRASLGVGAAMLGAGTLGYMVSMLGLASGLDPSRMLTVGIIGALLHVSARIRLPGWARTRDRQMEGVIERLTAALHENDEPERIGEG